MARFTIQPNRISESLCAQCRNGKVTRFRGGDLHIICSHGMNNTTVRGDVEACTEFDDKRVVPQWELEKIAWELRTDKSGKVLGFAPPKQDTK